MNNFIETDISMAFNKELKGVPPEKWGFRFTANLETLNSLKSKSWRKQTPPKI